MELQQINKMLDELKVHGHNQKNVADNIGTSSSGLSQIKKGTYIADATPIIEKLVSFYNRIISKQEQPSKFKTRKVEGELPFVETITTKEIEKKLSITAKKRSFAVICGLSGAGKTTAVKKYAEDHPETILLEVDESWTSKIFFAELSLRLGGTDKGTLNSLMNYCKKRLKGTEIPIIVDEVENLRIGTINLIRRMRDYSKIALIFVGTRELKSKLESQRGSQTQIYTRVKDYMFIGGLREPNELFCGEANKDVENLVKSIYPNATKSIINKYYKECNGNTRVLENLLERTSDVYRGYEYNDKPIDFEHVDLISKSADTLIFKGMELR